MYPMEPANSIITKLGGEAVVAEITGTASQTPYRWQYPRDRGGTNGLIPWKYHQVLLAYARRENIQLRPEEFLPVTSVDNRKRKSS